MNGFQLLPVFVVGLAGSVHCIGMCGGIVGALSTVPAAVIPIATARVSALPRVLAYNAGRIASYMLAGALAGGLAGGARHLASLSGLQLGLYWIANLMLVALGLYLMNIWRGLAWLEQAGRVLWQHAQKTLAPLMKTLVPAERPWQAFALGGMWGWLPCGMVYSVLLTAMFSGSALSGAAVMLAFGLGTLPMLTGLGLLGMRLQRALQRRAVRVACGLLVLAFGLLGLTRAAGGITPDWMTILCLTPHT